MSGPERIVVSCEHGGKRVPARYAALFEGLDAMLAGHRGWDAGALPLARWLARRLSSPLHATTVTRLLVDTNRSLHHRALFSEVVKSRLGRVERQEIVELHYLPHRRPIERRIRDWVRAGASVLHLAVHSFDPGLDPGRKDCDLGLLYDPRRRRERELCRRWQAALRDRELRVRRNYPYRGRADGLTTHLRKELPARRYLGIELEANQVLLGSPGGARRLRRALASAAWVLPARGVGEPRRARC